MAKKGFRTGRGEQRTGTIGFDEGHALHGLEMVVELRVPVGVIIGAQSGNIAQALPPFVKRIRSWNLEGDDGPVPVSIEAFGEHFTGDETAEVLSAWVAAVAGGVVAPLGQQSAATTSSESGG